MTGPEPGVVAPTVALVRERLAANAARNGFPPMCCACGHPALHVCSRLVPTWHATDEIIRYRGVDRFAERIVVVACAAGCGFEQTITGVEIER